MYIWSTLEGKPGSCPGLELRKIDKDEKGSKSIVSPLLGIMVSPSARTKCLHEKACPPLAQHPLAKIVQI